jgi:hypothetical protein
MDTDWTLVEVARDDADRTALYVLRNPGDLHTATIEARPEYDPLAALSDDADEQRGWIRYFVTWSRSGCLHADQMSCVSLLRLARRISAWELRVAEDVSLKDQIEEFARTSERLQFAAVENMKWGIPSTRTRLRAAAVAYESEQCRLHKIVEPYVGRPEAEVPDAVLEFSPQSAEAVMRSRTLSVGAQRRF